MKTVESDLPPSQIPVIIGVGEITHRPERVSEGKEPVALMAEALLSAERDSGATILGKLQRLEVIGQATWRYKDTASALSKRLDIQPDHMVNKPVSGEMSVRLLHEAAVRIANGEEYLCAFAGGESVNAKRKARRSGVELDWTPRASVDQMNPVLGLNLKVNPMAARLGVLDPSQIYPFYEMAFQSKHGQTPAEGTKESALLWSRYSEIAAENGNAWSRKARTPQDIAEVTPENRMISYPYTKYMVANSIVNQSAAVVVASLEWATDNGIEPEHCVAICGGGGATENEDFLLRPSYSESLAQKYSLDQAIEVVGGDSSAFDFAEIYSCFPIIPKMALETLELRSDVAPTVCGGLTFFGGPLGNYMTHGICGMTRKLRQKVGGKGLLYGNGGFATKHHALVLASDLCCDTSLGDPVPRRWEDIRNFSEAPSLLSDYTGKAIVETYTVLYDRASRSHGVVACRTPQGQRILAKVPNEDESAMALLLNPSRSAIGLEGVVTVDASGDLIWAPNDAEVRN